MYFFLSTLSHVKRIEGENLVMTEHQALHPNANDLENNFLKNNSRKKTYAEVIQATIMEDSSCDEAEDDLEDHSDTERNTN